MINQILNTCPTACTLWDDMTFIFRQSNRNINSICLTLSNWRSSISPNNLVNRAWNLIPGAVAWIIWKERNARSFKNSTLTVDRLTGKLRQLIKESIHAMDIMQQEGNMSLNDQRIIQILNLKAKTVPIGKNQAFPAMKQEKWGMPPFQSFKLNFDGA